jgi:hypothetical protein
MKEHLERVTEWTCQRFETEVPESSLNCRVTVHHRNAYLSKLAYRGYVSHKIWHDTTL